MTQEGAQPAADDPSLTPFCYFSLADSGNSTRSPRKSGLQNRGLERFAGKLVVRKPDCPFFGGGGESSTSSQSMVTFFPLQRQFIFLLLECYITATQKMKLQQEKASELK